MKLTQDFFNKFKGNIKNNVNLANYNWFNLGGPAEYLFKPENKEQLVNILTYHVLSGKVMSGDIAGKSLEVTMVNGVSAKINASYGVKIAGANVVTADVEASNGVIHVIDAVILPSE